MDAQNTTGRSQISPTMLGTIEGLCDKVFGSGLDPTDAMFRFGVGGNQNYRDVTVAGVGFDAAADLEAIHPRHHDV